MWAIIDKRAPKEAIDNLKKHFEVFEFESKDITYKEVSGHPDIFIYQDKDKLIIAPNSPKELIIFLHKVKADFSIGEKEVGFDLNNSTQYNCISSSNYLFHKKGFTDKSILDKSYNKKLIELPQAYTRCSLSMLNEISYITSDKGIKNALLKNELQILHVENKSILLPGFPYGFFGGTNGIFGNKFYLIGSLDFHPQGKEIQSFIENNGLEIIELYNGKLYDGGGLFFGN